jgi:putative tryptophan/tyrosine transport system substrate-binding protein
MSYGADYNDLHRPAALYVDKILTAVKPADLRVSQASKYELIINLKTANALGLGDSGIAPATRGQGDRITMPFAAVHESLVGPSRQLAW